MTYSLQWLSDPTAMRCILVEATAAIAGVETTIYLSSVGYVSAAADTPATTAYQPLINGGVSTSEQLSLSGDAALAYGDIELENTDGAIDGWLEYVWANRGIKVFFGDVRWAKSEFQLIFDGIIDDIDSRSRNTLNIKIRDKAQRLNVPISDTLLGGVTQNASQLIPLCFGECFNVEPLLIDPALLKFQVHNGPIERIIEVRDNGVPVAHTPDLSAGMFTLTNSPAGQITCSIQGDAPGYVYKNTIGALIQRMITGYWLSAARRFTSGDIDAVAFAAFESAHPQPVGIYLRSRENLLSAIQRLASSVGAQVFINRGGKISIAKISLPGTSTATLTDPDMVYDSLHIAQRVPVAAASKIGYCRNYTVQSNLKTGIPEAQKLFFAQEWLVVLGADAPTASLYKLTAEPVQRDTNLVAKSDAQAEADREIALYSVPRTIYAFEVFCEGFELRLGQYVTLICARYNLAAGKVGLIVRLAPNWQTFRCIVEVLV